jgi:dinuclear metal center YbgI/SA1388 family protein
MLTKDLIATIELHADPAQAADWDQSGMQVAGSKDKINRLALTLDPHPESIRKALDWNADFILTHHPLSLTPQLPKKRDDLHLIYSLLLQSGAGLYSAHTSLDVQTMGPPGWLAQALGCTKIQPILPIQEQAKMWICMNCSLLPPSALDQIITNPACLEWTTLDTECCILTFETQAEQIVSILAENTDLEMVRTKKTLSIHSRQGYGVLGRLPEPLSWPEMAQTLAKNLPCAAWTKTGLPPDRIQILGYCPGSGMDFAAKAFAQGADIFLSGDLKYHQAQQIEPLGLTLDVGHFALEETMMAAWARTLEHEFADQDLEVTFIPGHNPMTMEICSP